jgi:hypothetical protein
MKGLLINAPLLFSLVIIRIARTLFFTQRGHEEEEEEEGGQEAIKSDKWEWFSFAELIS